MFYLNCSFSGRRGRRPLQGLFYGVNSPTNQNLKNTQFFRLTLSLLLKFTKFSSLFYPICLKSHIYLLFLFGRGETALKSIFFKALSREIRCVGKWTKLMHRFNLLKCIGYTAEIALKRKNILKTAWQIFILLYNKSVSSKSLIQCLNVSGAFRKNKLKLLKNKFFQKEKKLWKREFSQSLW